MVLFSFFFNLVRQNQSKIELASVPIALILPVPFLFFADFFFTDNFPPKIVNAPSEINVTLDETLQLSITAEDDDTITFQVINKPPDATENQSGNVLYFSWNVTSTQKVNCI